MTEMNSESIRHMMDVLAEGEVLEIANEDVSNLFGNRFTMDKVIQAAGCMSRGSDDGRRIVIKKVMVETGDADEEDDL